MHVGRRLSEYFVKYRHVIRVLRFDDMLSFVLYAQLLCLVTVSGAHYVR